MIQLLKQANGNLPRTEEEKIQMIEEASYHYGKFLTALGFDWKEDQNSENTPHRVAKAWVNDLASGSMTEEPKISLFPNPEYDGLVFQGDIDLVSLCSHHNLAFTGKAFVAYIPKVGGNVIGLSKLNRIVDWYSRRPQLQEGLTTQIHSYLNSKIDNLGVAVAVVANHSCCSNRGIGHNSTMMTQKLSGVFLDNNDKSRDEFLNCINLLKK